MNHDDQKMLFHRFDLQLRLVNSQSSKYGFFNRHLQVTKMKTAMIAGILAITLFALAGPAFGICPYDLNCINNPYGAGNPYKADGLMNPYSPYGSPYSNRSWTNPFATEPPKIYDRQGNYRGRLSTNPFHPDSISNELCPKVVRGGKSRTTFH